MHGQFSIKFLNNHLLTWTRHIAHTQTTTLVQARARARTVSRVLRAALPEQGQRLLNSLQPRFRSSLTRFLPTTTLFPQHTRIHVRRDKVHARCTSAREIQRPHATCCPRRAYAPLRRARWAQRVRARGAPPAFLYQRHAHAPPRRHAARAGRNVCARAVRRLLIYTPAARLS